MKQPRNTLSILYYLKRGHLNRNGECPVMCRISVRGEKETFSSHVYTSPDNWDVKSARVIGRTAKVIEQNKILTDLQVTLTRHYYDIEQRNGYVTAEMIKNAYMGITAKAESLLPIYKEFLEETEALIGIQKSKKTYEKYERCYRRVVEFLRDKYHVSDIAFRDLKPMFLVDFEVCIIRKTKRATPPERNVPKIKRNVRLKQNEAYHRCAFLLQPLLSHFSKNFRPTSPGSVG